MADFALLRGGGSIPIGRVVSGDSNLVLLTAGTAHTKGAYAQLIAATARRVDGLWLHTRGVSASLWGLIDIAIGAAAAEVIVVPDVAIFDLDDRAIWLPLELPSGVRVAARWQASAGSATLRLGLSAHFGGSRMLRAFQVASAYGTTAASSWGTVVDSGGVANTYGSWTELAASTARPIHALLVMVQRGSTTNNESSVNHLIDIGIGAAGSEVPVVEQEEAWGTSSTDKHFHPTVFPVDIPSGSRLVARSRCSTTNANARLLTVSVIGFD